ncbi:MAG: SAM-dependent chlorinase/fluorinase, partial [Planctomycetota bacterium]
GGGLRSNPMPPRADTPSPPALITLTTDFGEGSRYVAVMKGVIYSINPAATIVDVTHAVPPQDIAAGARVLREAVLWFPAGTIHVVVVDPGVGGARQVVCCEAGEHRIVCPNNGLLTFLAAAEMPLKLWSVENERFRLPAVSATFHGRDIMAPAAAHLSRATPPHAFGSPVPEPVLLTQPRPVRKTVAGEPGGQEGTPDQQEAPVAQRVEGEVIEVDSFGNLITNISEPMLEACPRDESVLVGCDGHETLGIWRTYSDQPEMTLIALVGSSGELELAIVNDSAKMMLGVGVGAKVTVKW